MNIPLQRKLRAIKDDRPGRWVHLNAVAYDRAKDAWDAALARVPRREDLGVPTGDPDSDATAGYPNATGGNTNGLRTTPPSPQSR